MTVGYVLSRYPLLSETFILREMLELERQGQKLHVYALRPVRGRWHPRVSELEAEVWWTPWLGGIWGIGCHVRWLCRRPAIYLRTLASVLWHTRGDFNLWAGAVAYWGKAVMIAERLRRDGVEHLHAHYATHPALVAYVGHRLTGVPYTFTVHAHDLYCHHAMLAQKRERALAVVTVSKFNQRLLEAKGPALRPWPPVVVIHCGVELETYRRLAAARCAPGVERPLRVLAIGSLQPYKGHRHLVDACAELRHRGIAFQCRIVGGGELEQRIRAQIQALGLTQQVALAGAATEAEVVAALEWAQVVALPSVVAGSGKMEGIPVALMEAMASGLPVVASRLSGIPELVRDGVEGLLIPPGDAAALARALARLTDAGTRQRLGEAGRRRVAAEFELAANVTRLRGLWQPAAAAKREEAEEAAA